MARFIRLTLAMLILLAPCVVLVRLVGNISPDASLASLFLNPDGTLCLPPCILGIRPGETAAEEIAAALSAHSLTDNVRAMEVLNNTYLFTANGNAMSLAFSVEAGGEVNYVHFSFLERPEIRRSAGPTLGEVIQAFGAPDFVIDRTTSKLYCRCDLILVFLDAGLEVFVPRQEPIPEQVSPGYWLSDFIVLRLRVCPASAQDVPTLAWNGFTALSRYTENGAVKVFYRATDHMFPIVCLAPQTST